MNKELKKLGIEYRIKLINNTLSPAFPKNTVFTANRLENPNEGGYGVFCFTKKNRRFLIIGQYFPGTCWIRIHFPNPGYKDCFVFKENVLYMHKVKTACVPLMCLGNCESLTGNTV